MASSATFAVPQHVLHQICPYTLTEASEALLTALYEKVSQHTTLSSNCVAIVLTYRHPPFVYYLEGFGLAVLSEDPSPDVYLLLDIYNVLPGPGVVRVLDDFTAIRLLKTLGDYIQCLEAETDDAHMPESERTIRHQILSKVRLILAQARVVTSRRQIRRRTHRRQNNRKSESDSENCESLEQVNFIRYDIRNLLEDRLGMIVQQDKDHATVLRI